LVSSGNAKIQVAGDAIYVGRWLDTLHTIISFNI
jgi:hypothetical protein